MDPERNRSLQILYGALAVDEPEQLVLYDRAAQPSTKLRALERRIEAPEVRQLRCH